MKRLFLTMKKNNFSLLTPHSSLSLTSLNAHEKISKSDSRIELRGRLDSLNAQIILFQAASNNPEFINDLEEIRNVIIRLQACEACEKVFDEILILWGLDENEIHERSHNPRKFFNKGHLLLNYKMGREASEINFLRTLTREVELCACRTFNDEDKYKIIHVLNRLSSALYILIYKYIPEDFNVDVEKIF